MAVAESAASHTRAVDSGPPSEDRATTRKSKTGTCWTAPYLPPDHAPRPDLRPRALASDPIAGENATTQQNCVGISFATACTRHRRPQIARHISMAALRAGQDHALAPDPCSLYTPGWRRSLSETNSAMKNISRYPLLSNMPISDPENSA